MASDNGSTDRQPDSHAALFGREDRIEEPLNDGRVDDDAGIGHDSRHLAVRVNARGDDEFSKPVGYVGHRIDPFNHEVQHDLLQLDVIAAIRAARCVPSGCAP